MNTRDGRQRRKLASHSKRSLDAACRLANLPVPQTADELGEAFLALLVRGIDHLHVGQPVWFKAILDRAPGDRRTP